MGNETEYENRLKEYIDLISKNLSDKIEQLYDSGKESKTDIQSIERRINDIERETDKLRGVIEALVRDSKKVQELESFVFQLKSEFKSLKESIAEIKENTDKKKSNLLTLVIAVVAPVLTGAIFWILNSLSYIPKP